MTEGMKERFQLLKDTYSIGEDVYKRQDENFLMAVATVGAILLGDYSEGVAVMLFYQIGAVSYTHLTDFPDDLTGYDLIIQCGACMFNRKYVMYRIDRAKKQQVPVTNYGITLSLIHI